MRPSPRLLLLALTSLFILPGCVSYWRGKDMEADIAALQGQVEQMNEDNKVQREKLNQYVQESLKNLETRLGDAINQLQNGSAEAGLVISKLQDQIRVLSGQLEEANRKLAQAADNPLGVGPGAAPMPGVVTPPNAPALPESEPELYRYGYDRHKAGDFDEAVRAFGVYVSKYPSTQQADNALFLMAEAQAKKTDYAGSIKTLQTILKNYQKGDKVDDALILMHDDFVALKRCKDALPFLETLLADYPRSPRAAEAKKKLAATQRSCK